MPQDALTAYGWTAEVQRAFHGLALESAVPARVVATARGQYRIATGGGLLAAGTAGHLRRGKGTLPVVGDWVAAEVAPGAELATIRAVVPSRSRIVRKAAGALRQQVLAANVDIVFIVTSCDNDLSPRRIERYLALVWEGGASPVVLVNKTDLTDNPDAWVAVARDAAIGVPVHPINALASNGLEPLEVYLVPGRTIVLLGSSGVGKSTIVNRLMARDVQAVRASRPKDAKGRHTTTSRELFALPSGALLIDTPGLREVGLWSSDAGIERTFPEIDSLAASCRFGDCRHEEEPGCAVVEAVARGELSADRRDAYLHLRRELDHLERQRDPALRAEQRRHWKSIHKDVRAARRRGWLR